MRKISLLITVFISSLYAAADVQRDTVYVSEFGLKPYSYENSTPALQKAIQACKDRKAKVLSFDAGRYDFWPEGAERREWFISNTSSEEECPSKIKTVGMLLEDMDGLTVDGNNATLIFHGKMITMAVAHSRNISLRNLHVDFERPSMSEMTYVAADTTGTTVKFHRDVRYQIDANHRIHLFGEGWRSNHYHCIEYNPVTERSSYSTGWNVLASSPATELECGRVHFATPSDFAPTVGNTLSVRDII
ncbi:MAG: right-handed parallel beta-helix repeat-containing protein, partial [Coprobacter sp.]|nr:right-handed parallel beta-helix repeat-containing protein [Coprobacter sp.]